MILHYTDQAYTAARAFGWYTADMGYTTKNVPDIHVVISCGYLRNLIHGSIGIITSFEHQDTKFCLLP